MVPVPQALAHRPFGRTLWPSLRTSSAPRAFRPSKGSADRRICGPPGPAYDHRVLWIVLLVAMCALVSLAAERLVKRIPVEATSSRTRSARSSRWWCWRC